MVSESARARRQRSAWDGRTGSWQEQVEASPAFARVREELLVLADPASADRCADLGAGTGFLTLALAPCVESILAVDVSPEMLATLRSAAAQAGVANVETRTADLAKLQLPSGSLDLVVSNYALHSLPHRDKARVLRAAHAWLRPGGRIVIADMMLGRGLSARDRAIVVEKVRRLSRRGPSGLWRALRNSLQLGLGIGENRPATPVWWTGSLRDAGFVRVRHRDVVAEAGIVLGIRR